MRLRMAMLRRTTRTVFISNVPPCHVGNATMRRARPRRPHRDRRTFADSAAYGQVGETIVTVSTLSFGAFAFAFEDADGGVVVVELEGLAPRSTVPAMVTL